MAYFIQEKRTTISVVPSNPKMLVCKQCTNSFLIPVKLKSLWIT